MPLLKDGAVADDPWTNLADDDALPADGPAIVSLKRWRAERDALIARPGPLGLRLTSEQTPGQVADDLGHFQLVALDFPAFTDGRSFSNARRLRDRYGFKGEVRATGAVCRDQFWHLKRCGFDAVVVSYTETVDGWEAAVAAITTPYQPASDGGDTVLSLRQRRLAAAC
ncbi:MAG: DUF934 domain-containing protein [Rhodospirillaceae bacterium]